MLQELAEAHKNAEKITKVYIGEVAGPHFSAEEFHALRQLANLKTVEVMYVGQGDAVLTSIQGMPSIEKLSFYHAGVTSKGTRYLNSFPNLKHLDIDRVDDEMRLDIEKLQEARPNCKVSWGTLDEDERATIHK